MLPSPLASPGSANTVPDRPDADTGTPALAPRAIERLHRIHGDLRTGLPVILQDGVEATLLALVERLTDARYAAMAALGQPELVLTRRRAEALGALPPIPGDTLRLRVPPGADLAWLTAVAGQAGRGSPAAGTSLPILQAGGAPHRAAIEIAKAMQAVPAVLSVPLAGRDDGGTAGLGLSTIPLSLVAEAMAEVRSQTRVSSARLPMDASSAGRVHVFRPDDGGAEHYAIEIGTPDLSGPVTVRLHSACFTGDVLGSLKCDCGPQLRAAMATMAEGDGGVLLYLNQEGRGIGLANKMRAYALQETGMDTVEANHWLGFEDDQRDFRVGAQILRRMGIGQVRLMTNNPAKTASLAAQGIAVVESVPLRVGRTVQNAHYLATKAAKSGHLL
ncbi:GTP cyclohydrolase II [Roseibacterium sp. SDUM158017]|uniref:GTP cyclohydrolase II n=1 Tax=Roseicyclus salinarum TaxID=3036773 RepID=UPI0024150EAC|nr:GTP cyclohydrolase II [Roseibacterium sp. SDUM158017]MDG4648690.1 GTP cyclohydrolase II [Roseibacterium sp. SDUM158017]